MKIRVLSDLHLEHCSDDGFVATEHDSMSTLVLAGDICELRLATSLLVPFLNRMCERFRHVVYVYGNHEYYNGAWPTSGEDFRARTDLAPNLQILDPGMRILDDVAFVGATLWSRFEIGGRNSLEAARRYMSDYRCITRPIERRHGTVLRTLFPEDTLQAHQQTCEWLGQTLAQCASAARKTVLVTHHGISPQSIHERFAGDELNGAFVSDLESLLAANPPALAIHGHTHSSLDYVLDFAPTKRTRVVANPRGYPLRGARFENPDYQPNLMLEI